MALPEGLVDAPLTFAEVEVTPGCFVLKVIDLDTMTELNDVTKVDTEAGLAWRCIHPELSRRSHPFLGRYKLMCLPEHLKEFEAVWKSCQ